MLFTTGNLSEATKTKMLIEKQPGFDFKDGARVLQFMLKRYERDDLTAALKVAFKSAENTAWCRFNDFLATIPTATYNKLVQKKGPLSKF